MVFRKESVYASFQNMVFFRYMPKSGIADHMVGLFLVFLRSLHTVIHSRRTSLHSHQQSRRVPFSPHPLHHLQFVEFWEWPFWHVWGGNFTVVLICIFLISKAEHIFMNFFCHLCLLWRNTYLDLLPSFWLGCLYIFNFVYVEINPLSVPSLQKFSPILMVVFFVLHHYLQ